MSEWTKTTLGRVMTAVDLRNRDKVVSLVLSVTEGRGIIPQTEVFKKRIATDDTSRYKVIQPLDIAWNPYLLWRGAIGQWLGEEPGVTSPVYPVYRCRPDQDARFWGLVLESGRLTPYFDSRAIGTIQRRRRTTPAVFTAAPVEAPPLPVQDRIVEVIGAVDDQIAALDAEAEVLDAIWWSLGRKMSDALGSLDLVRLDAIASISGGLTKNKKDSERPDLIEVPYLRVANVHRRNLDLREVATIKTTRAKADALRLLPGDILMNEGGDRDKLGRGDVWAGQIEDCIHQNHVFRVRVTDEQYSPRFVSAWANTFGQKWFETFGTQTTGIASINKATLSRFPVPDVPREVQDGWTARLDAVVSVHEETRVEAERLRAVRASLLSALLNREIEIDVAEEAVA